MFISTHTIMIIEIIYGEECEGKRGREKKDGKF